MTEENAFVRDGAILRVPLPSAKWLKRQQAPFPTSPVDQVQIDVLFFNRIPKTGSENMVFLLNKLAKINNFKHKRYGQPQPRKLTVEQQVCLKAIT